MNEKQLTIQTLEQIQGALAALQARLDYMDNFMRDNFSRYSSYYTNFSGYHSSIGNSIRELKVLTMTNKDHLNKLEQTEYPKPTPFDYMPGGF